MNSDERRVREVFQRHVGDLQPSVPMETVRRRARRGRLVMAISSATALAAFAAAAVVVVGTFERQDRKRVVGPAPSAEAGLIAFTTQDGNDMMPWIAIVPATGGEVTRLREGADPSWSPDGTRLVFTCHPAICIMEADGSNLIRLTDPGESMVDEGPDWGSRGLIAFTRSYLAGGTARKILLVPERGGKTTTLINQEANFSADWHPDGRRLALVRGLGDRLEAPVGGFQLWTMRSDGTALRQLTDIKSGVGRPDWAPDGASIAFDSAEALWTIAADGGKPMKLPAVSGRGFDVGSGPSWSPDGQRLVFTCAARTDGNDLCISDGDGDVKVLLGTRESEASPAWQPLSQGATDTERPVESAVPTEAGEPFQLLVHCGLSVPLEFDDRLWLPVDPRLRRTQNPPDGFGSDENYDVGTIRVVDDDTIIYTSSEGVEVEYEPTKRGPVGCE